MPEEEVKEEEVESAEGAQKPPIVKILIIAIVGIVLIAASALTAYFISKKEPPAPSTQDTIDEAIKVEPLKTFTIGDIKTVLADGSNFKAGIVLAFEKKYASKAKFMNELEERKPQIINIILSIVLKKKKQDLVGANIEKLREELKVNINKYLIEGQINDIYFTDYVVQ